MGTKPAVRIAVHCFLPAVLISPEKRPIRPRRSASTRTSMRSPGTTGAMKRAFSMLSAQNVEVELVLQTRNRSYVASVIDAMTAAGFDASAY